MRVAHVFGDNLIQQTLTQFFISGLAGLTQYIQRLFAIPVGMG